MWKTTNKFTTVKPHTYLCRNVRRNCCAKPKIRDLDNKSKLHSLNNRLELMVIIVYLYKITIDKTIHTNHSQTYN